MESIYICHFSNGVIKVGRSTNPETRLRQHLDRVACVGLKMVDSRAAACVGNAGLAEAALIALCRTKASAQHKNEWFEGIDFDEACGWMEMAAATEFKKAEPIPRAAVPTRPDLPDRPMRYSCLWKDGQHYWMDSQPNKPHWPDSAVMRWDLLPDKWHAVWPELITHPCAILFAPMHPLRDGPPKFADWVTSWPASFDKTEFVAALPTAGREIAEAIWPELAEAKTA